MRPILDLTSFLTIIPQSRFWEAYVQGRRAIHVEYGNLDSVEPQLKLTSIDRWGARITAFDRKERFVIEGSCNSKMKKVHGKILVRTSPCDSPPPAEVQTLQEEVRPEIDPEATSSEELWQQILTRLEWIIATLREEKFQVKVWCGQHWQVIFGRPTQEAAHRNSNSRFYDDFIIKITDFAKFKKLVPLDNQLPRNPRWWSEVIQTPLAQGGKPILYTIREASQEFERRPD